MLSNRVRVKVRDGRVVIKDAADLPIGKHNDIPDDQFDASEMAKGMVTEKEHTDNPDIAKAIVKDHLSENKLYYSWLEKMEIEAKTKDKI